MILIADSGSTKTTWCLLNQESGKKEIIQTAGINPFYQDEVTIVQALKNEFTFGERTFDAIYFYSAGCANPEISKVAFNALDQFFNTGKLEIESDLMAAAHALCGNSEGIACILGTGSNSCHYNGKEIVESVSPLGFILGDEGSGAVIGKKLLADVLKNQLPPYIQETFFNQYKTSYAEILENIYKKPFPNRYAAGFTKFISEHKDEQALQELVIKSFDDFLTRNVLQYKKAKELPVHFTGSIAYYFRDLLDKALEKHKLKLGNIIKDPMDGLINFHLK
ncbi:BadF/BadG/BcrA/BcrD ATPase family protein [Marinilabilia rubra]|uniref:ATPase n=1 Tax=Marinilabilia rubra TaxID=2162893 RepID=A0A2U2BDG2_9BACT|nr:BadF/BadG/BcrA/BcrD ATPase family protein [Marinilabilia rubra]PWE01073.1 ATPase [Marinilabilia rubra]